MLVLTLMLFAVDSVAVNGAITGVAVDSGSDGAVDSVDQ